MEFFATKILIVATRLPSFAQTQAIRAYFSCLANSLESSTSSSSSMYTMATFLSRTKFKFFSQHAQMSFDAAVGKERSPQLGAQRRTGCFGYSLLIICFSWSWRNLSRSTFNTTVSKKYLSALGEKNNGVENFNFWKTYNIILLSASFWCRISTSLFFLSGHHSSGHVSLSYKVKAIFFS